PGPHPLEQRSGPDASAGDLERRLLLRGRKHHRLGGKPCARSQQPLQLAARLQFLVTAERGDHLLANLVAVTPALDDLQIGAPGSGVAAKIHTSLPNLVRTQPRFEGNIQQQSDADVTLHFWTTRSSTPGFMRVSEPSDRRNCRRW